MQANNHTSEDDGLSVRYRRYALTILFLLYTFNFLDRQIVNILAEPIKRDLHLADWQLGSLTGLSFALFYASLALPIARLAERGDRVKIVAASAIVWSLFTGLCGLAQNFLQLFLTRVAVGVGEAGCTPASHSLISDYTTREKRASAMATFSLGIPVGSLVGMAVGGLIADSLGWRFAFLIVGLPGVVLGLIALFTLPEPRRSAIGKVDKVEPPSFRDALSELSGNRAYIWMTVAMILMCFVNYGQLAFHSSFFLRNHADGLDTLARQLQAFSGIALGPTGFLGVVLGIVIGVFGGIGTWLGGALADRAARTDIRAYATVPAIAALALPLPIMITYLSPGALSALILLSVPMLLQSVYYGPIFASVQSLVRSRTRATAAAIFLFFGNLVGLGFGPLTVGMLSDVLAAHLGSGEGLRWALVVTAFASTAAAGAFFMARRTIRDDIVS
ncbi:MFS transporter [Sphingosinicella sp.]|uniref:spinster family MFS transporter n=1 Tax=Sphingosinicella sp. TaxID=1917971 RepID=UPI0017A786D4|nr:MFS transporter [Sphingosinicella sp.]MBA4758215.1 MFS transporter [Sphingosinicella sp.]